MKSETNNRIGNKAKVTKLINQGLFDDHIDELSKALYTSRLFTKDIKCYFNDIRNKNVNKYLTPKNSDHKKIFHYKLGKTKTILSSPNKKSSGDVNSYELMKYKEDDINKEMDALLKLLNNSQEETKNRFNELRKENDSFNSIYKICKSLVDKNNKSNNQENNIFLFLYDLLLKYKSNKNLTFDMNSLFSDFLRETPLGMTDSEKLKFYYIINSERFDQIKNPNQNKEIKKEKKINPLLSLQSHNNEENTFKKLEIPKEPKVIDMTKIKYLKEIRFLNKVNKRAKYKIITGGSLIGVNTNKSSQPKLKDIKLNVDGNENMKKKEKLKEFGNNEDDEDDYEKFDFMFEDKEKFIKNENKIFDRDKLRLDIEKDISDIETLKKTIRDSFKEEKKTTLRLRKSNSNFDQIINKLRQIDRKKSNLYLSSNNNYERKKTRLISIDNYNNNNQVSTIYSNQSRIFNNNNSDITNTSQINPNNSIRISYKFNDTKSKKVTILRDDFSPFNENKRYTSRTKLNRLKKSKTLKSNFFEKQNKLLENILNNQTEDIYSISKNINGKNSKSTINKIKNYLKYRNSKLPILYSGHKLKDNFFFFHRIKNEVQINDIKYKFQNVRKMLNEKEKRKINDISLLESNLVNKEKELLVKVLKDKF